MPPYYAYDCIYGIVLKLLLYYCNMLESFLEWSFVVNELNKRIVLSAKKKDVPTGLQHIVHQIILGALNDSNSTLAKTICLALLVEKKFLYSKIAKLVLEGKYLHYYHLLERARVLS